MSTGMIVTVVFIGLVVLGLVWTVFHYQRATGARKLLQGLALILVPIGLYVAGVMNLIGNGVDSIIRWVRRTPLDAGMIAGLSLFAAGVVVWVIASVIRPLTRDEARQRREARIARGPGTPAVTDGAAPRGSAAGVAARGGSTVPGSVSGGAGAGATGGGAAQPAAPARSRAEKDEDREIEALLKKRGIE